MAKSCTWRTARVATLASVTPGDGARLPLDLLQPASQPDQQGLAVPRAAEGGSTASWSP